MAIEVFPDSPNVGMSPRISFSHDLSQCDVVPVEQYIRTSSSSAIDFDFCVFRESFDQESSSADELFFDGKILPIQIKKRLAPPLQQEAPPLPLPPPPPAPLLPQPQKPSKINNDSKNRNSELPEEKHKSFWRFKRSTSLNCGSGYGRTFCPLPLLSRSNSTGSSASGKRSSLTNNQKQNLLKHSSLNSSSSHKQARSAYSSRPPLKKNSHASHGNGIKFNPVLNVPPANLFGLGSIFSGGKDRSKKKY